MDKSSCLQDVENTEALDFNAPPTKSFLNSLISSAKSATTSKFSRAKRNVQSFFHPTVPEESSPEDIDAKTTDRSNITVREKLTNVWLSFKYGNWRSKSRIDFSDHAALWLLGSSYSISEDESSLQEFLFDYYSRIWLTYRKELQMLPGTSKTTDCGWGCMIRSCQMLIAEALVLLHLGRSWRFSQQQAKEISGNRSKYSYANILSLFGDDVEASLGLYHALVISLERFQRPVDSWYSPSEAIYLFREALNDCNPEVTGGLKLVCINDGFLVKDELLQVSENFKNPLLLIICVRFGTTKVNMIYRDHILNLLNLKNTVGMIGGRPKHSLYFIGSYDSKYLVYLDPHVVHKAVSSALQPDYWQIFHCTDVLRISLDKIDPSCAFGFLIKTSDDLENLLEDFKKCHVIGEEDTENSTLASSRTLISVALQRPALNSCNVKTVLGSDPSFEVVGFDCTG